MNWPAALLKRSCGTCCYLWIMRNLSEHLIWGTSRMAASVNFFKALQIQFELGDGGWNTRERIEKMLFACLNRTSNSHFAIRNIETFLTMSFRLIRRERICLPFNSFHATVIFLYLLKRDYWWECYHSIPPERRSFIWISSFFAPWKKTINMHVIFLYPHVKRPLAWNGLIFWANSIYLLLKMLA